MKKIVVIIPLLLTLSQVAHAFSADMCFASIEKSSNMSVYYGKDRQILKDLQRGSERYNKQLINVNEDAHLAAAYINHAKKACSKN